MAILSSDAAPPTSNAPPDTPSPHVSMPRTEGRGHTWAGYTAYTHPFIWRHHTPLLPTVTIVHWTLSVPHPPADDNTPQVTGGGRG